MLPDRGPSFGVLISTLCSRCLILLKRVFVRPVVLGLGTNTQQRQIKRPSTPAPLSCSSASEPERFYRQSPCKHIAYYVFDRAPTSFPALFREPLEAWRVHIEMPPKTEYVQSALPICKSTGVAAEADTGSFTVRRWVGFFTGLGKHHR